jgi:hypothetical protein
MGRFDEPKCSQGGKEKQEDRCILAILAGGQICEQEGKKEDKGKDEYRGHRGRRGHGER